MIEGADGGRMGGGVHRARRRFGQNFLVDPRAAGRIVEALAPVPGERVVEIGPGRGALTVPLVEAGARVVAVELDRDLAKRLRDRFGAALDVVEADVLSTDLRELADGGASSEIAVVGNLPYNISKPMVAKLVAERHVVSRAVLTFQREVAERLTAAPGSRAYGPLGILAGRAYSIRSLFEIAPGAFRPRPAVRSTVTRWIRRENDLLAGDRERRLRRCLAACFAHRRRTVLNNLRAALPGGEAEAYRLLSAADVDPGLRAEAIPPERFCRLVDHWPDAAPNGGAPPPVP